MNCMICEIYHNKSVTHMEGYEKFVGGKKALEKIPFLTNTCFLLFNKLHQKLFLFRLNSQEIYH